MSGRFLLPSAYGLSGKGFFPARPAAASTATLQWTQRTSNAPDTLFTAGFGHHVFLGLIDTTPADLVRSTDAGTTWTLEAGVGPAGVGVDGLATDGAGVWMFGTGTDGIHSSFPYLSIDEGQTFAPVASSPFGTAAGTAAIGHSPHGGSLWVAFGDSATQGLVSFSSDNGTTWSAPVAINKGFDNSAVIFDGTQLIALGTSAGGQPALYNSTDAVTWTETLLPATVLRNRPIAAGNGFFMVGDQTANQVFVANTLAGLTAAVAKPVTFFPDTGDTALYSVGYGLFQGLPTFVAIGLFGGSALSRDAGLTWTPTVLNFPPVASGNAAQVVVFGDNTFVALGDAGDISTLP